MKKLFKNIVKTIKTKASSIVSAIGNFVRKAANSIVSVIIKTKANLCSARGEGYLDTAVKLIISVVLGGLILAALYTLFNSTILPSLGDKVSNMFDYAG